MMQIFPGLTGDEGMRLPDEAVKLRFTRPSSLRAAPVCVCVFVFWLCVDMFSRPSNTVDSQPVHGLKYDHMEGTERCRVQLNKEKKHGKNT